MTEVLSEHTLMTVEELTELLEVTEAVEEEPFEYGGYTSVAVEEKTGAASPLYLVLGERDAETGVAHEFALTQDAATQLFKNFKIPPVLLENAPFDIILPVLNWFLANQPGSLKALVVRRAGQDDRIAAFCRVGTEIYSSVDMLNTMLTSLRDKYGITEVLVSNAVHDLNFTNYTLMFPQTAEQIEGTGEVLLTGLNFQTSVLGLKPTMVNGVVARDYHFNSMVSTTAVQQWNRKQARSASLDDIVDGDEESYDVYDWLGEAVTGLHAIRNNDIVAVKRLRRLSLAGHSGEFLSDVFAKYSIPVGTRNIIRLNYEEQEEQTIYGLWNAITETANDDEVQEKPALVRKLMEVGGELAFHPESCPSCHRLKDLE